MFHFDIINSYNTANNANLQSNTFKYVVFLIRMNRIERRGRKKSSSNKPRTRARKSEWISIMERTVCVENDIHHSPYINTISERSEEKPNSFPFVPISVCACVCMFSFIVDNFFSLAPQSQNISAPSASQWTREQHSTAEFAVSYIFLNSHLCIIHITACQWLNNYCDIQTKWWKNDHSQRKIESWRNDLNPKLNHREKRFLGIEKERREKNIKKILQIVAYCFVFD